MLLDQIKNTSDTTRRAAVVDRRMFSQIVMKGVVRELVDLTRHCIAQKFCGFHADDKWQVIGSNIAHPPTTSQDTSQTTLAAFLLIYSGPVKESVKCVKSFKLGTKMISIEIKTFTRHWRWNSITPERV